MGGIRQTTFGDDPERVLKYLARSRTSGNLQRPAHCHERWPRLRFKDYRDGAKWKTTSLEGIEFIRRFLLHVLPSGFMKIRHYGLLANRFRKEKLALCRELLGVPVAYDVDHQDVQNEFEDGQCDREIVAVEADRCQRCPKCKIGRMRIVKTIAADRDRLFGPAEEESTLRVRAPPTEVARKIA